MLNIKLPPKKNAAAAIPAALTTLSVSWLNKQFKAVAVHRGHVDGSWENPAEIEGTSHFEALIGQAIQHTGYRGQTVSLVLAHPRLVQQLLELPPVQGAALTKLIERQAQQQKFFQGEAAWTWQIASSTKEGVRVILHLFPKILLDQLLQACRRHHLHLVAVVPPSVVLHQQLSQLWFGTQEPKLLAAETGGSTTVVITRHDGQLLLARTLPGTWNDDAQRLALDLNRTLLYANQQFGVAIKNQAWVFGPGAREQAPSLQRQLQLPVQLSPEEDHPLYWATEAAKLRPAQCPNFISSRLQNAPQRRIFATVVAAGAILALLVCLGASGLLYLQARQEAANIQSLTRDYERLQARHKELQMRNVELARKHELVQLVNDGRPAPVPLWFLAYLGEAVPADLAVTNLDIRQVTGAWKVRLAGALQPNESLRTSSNPSNAVALLRERLANGPFHLKFGAGEESKKTSVPASAGPAAPEVLSWVTRVSSTTAVTNAPVARDHFAWEGVMRDE